MLVKEILNEDVTSNPAFQRWFAGSKVVDRQGRPLLVYHGSQDVFTVFGGTAKQKQQWRREREQLRRHIGDFPEPPEHFHYFIDQEGSAGSYGRNVRAYYLSIKNPLDLTDMATAKKVFRDAVEMDVQTPTDVSQEMQDIQDEIREWAIRYGYDGIVQPDSTSSSTVYASGTAWVAFYPQQIKSATHNNGNFSPRSADSTK